MITLYHSPFTRSHLIRFALEELGLPHEVRAVDMARGEHKGAAFLDLNPLGQLPVLVDGSLVLREAAAIALHLGDQMAEHRLAPAPSSPERAAYYQWVVFSVASELRALSKIALHTRVLPAASRIPAVVATGRDEWAAVARALTLAVHGKTFLLDTGFSLADVMVGGTLSLAQVLGVLSPYPELVAYFGRVSERPAFRRAYVDAVSA